MCGIRREKFKILAVEEKGRKEGIEESNAGKILKLYSEKFEDSKVWAISVRGMENENFR